MTHSTNRMELEEEIHYASKSKNVRELEMLRHEIDNILGNDIEPPHSWYETRYNHIEIYSELGWLSLAHRFYQKDHYMHDSAQNVIHNLEVLQKQFHQTRQFHLPYYQHLIHDIENIWNYYQDKYIGDESDPDIGDLIVGLTYISS
jgi:hypothetical protein